VADHAGARTIPSQSARGGRRSEKTLSTFKELGALPQIADALEAVGIVEAFPIQEMTLPIALLGTDLIGQARTGTGKTLAFSVPLLQRIVSPQDPDYAQLAAPGKPQALVIAPTRELALQVAGDLALAGSKRDTRSVTVYGGVPYEAQLDALKSGVEVVVGTPGRLLDLVQRRALDLSHVKVLVLDEADEMLDLGFLPDVERLIRQTPEFRQTLLFSATMRGEVVTLARRYMRHPVNITAESTSEQRTVPATAQFVYQVHQLDKPEILGRIMQAEDRGRSIVFTTTKRKAQQVADDLVERGFAAEALHGDMAQQARERAMSRFREGRADILVATDVAARGIDVDNVTHVVNYSCPDDDKMYLHRIGRTGRAGASGIAITLVDWADVTRWRVINKALDLPYEEVAETYSTSPELFHELGIPAGVTGRLVPAKPEEKRQPRARDGERPGRDGQRRSRGDEHRGGPDGRPRRERRRRSASGSEPKGDGRAARTYGSRVDGSGPTERTGRAAPAEATQATDGVESSERGAGAQSAEGRPQRSRRRTRRRPGDRQPSGQTQSPRAAAGSGQDLPSSGG
jgi:superfamily II DNA/RNA helicase